MTQVNGVSSASPSRQTLGGDNDYQVVHGDTLSKIAGKYGVSVSDLMAANPRINNPDVIYPGDYVAIPAASAAPANAAPPTASASGSFDYNRIAGVRGNPNVTPQFISGVEAMASRLGTRPEYLMAVMSFETGGSFSPAQKNNAGGSATGLIQFMPATAAGLGTSTAALAKMSSTEQLAYVEKYFDQRAGNGNLGTLEGVYTSVLYGSPRSDPATTLWSSGSSAYAANKGLDTNHDGRITAGEAANKVRGRIDGGAGAGATTGSVSVRAGQTLSSIAHGHGVSLAALIKANPQITDPNRIEVGQSIHLPR